MDGSGDRTEMLGTSVSRVPSSLFANFDSLQLPHHPCPRERGKRNRNDTFQNWHKRAGARLTEAVSASSDVASRRFRCPSMSLSHYACSINSTSAPQLRLATRPMLRCADGAIPRLESWSRKTGITHSAKESRLELDDDTARSIPELTSPAFCYGVMAK